WDSSKQPDVGADRIATMLVGGYDVHAPVAPGVGRLHPAAVPPPPPWPRPPPMLLAPPALAPPALLPPPPDMTAAPWPRPPPVLLAPPALLPPADLTPPVPAATSVPPVPSVPGGFAAFLPPHPQRTAAVTEAPPNQAPIEKKSRADTLFPILSTAAQFGARLDDRGARRE